MYLTNFFILDYKGIQINLIKTNSFKFHELKLHKKKNTNFTDKNNKTIIIFIPYR